MAKRTAKRVDGERQVANGTAEIARAGAAELAGAGLQRAAEGLAAVGALARDVANAAPGWSSALTTPFFKRGKRVH